MNVHRPEETTTFQLYAAALEGTEAQIAGLVEMFLDTGTSSVTSQATSKVRSGHNWLRCMRWLQRVKFQAVLKWTKMKMSHIPWEMKLTKKRKKTKKILQKKSALLPAYQMLQNMSTHCCDVSPRSQSNNPRVSHSCDVNTLFGEAAAHCRWRSPVL